MSTVISRAFVCAALLLGALASASAVDSVQVTATNPTANEQGLAPGQVTFHRDGSSAPLTVNYTITGSAVSNLSGAYVSGAKIVSAGAGYFDTSFSFAFAGGATGTAFSVGGHVTGITLSGPPGTGYTTVPAVTISSASGVGAQATAVTDGVVTGVTVTSGGTGYSAGTPPTIVFSYGNATATPVITGGTISSINITSGGTGYSIANPPTITIVGGSPTTLATATATVTLNVTGFTVTSVGTGYLSAPIVTVATSPGGTTPAATATIAGSPLSSVVLTNSGSNYATSTVTIADAGGSHGSQATAVVTNGVVTTVALGTGGSGFAMPTVAFSGGGGSGAAAELVVNGGVITQVRLLQPGSGYTSAPTATITNAGGGTGASIDVTLTNGQVSNLQLHNGAGGSGYPSPTVTLNPNGTTAANITATTDEGVVTALTLVSGGAGYPGPGLASVAGGTTQGTVSAVVNGADYVAPTGSALVNGVVTGNVFFAAGQTDVTLAIAPLRNGVGEARQVTVNITPSTTGAYTTNNQNAANVIISDADISATMVVDIPVAYPTLPSIPDYNQPRELQGAAEWQVNLFDDNHQASTNLFRTLAVQIGGDASIGPQAQDGSEYTLVWNPLTIAQMLVSSEFGYVVPSVPPNAPPNPLPVAPGPGASSVILSDVSSFEVNDVVFFQNLAILSAPTVNGIYTITGIDQATNTVSFTPSIGGDGQTVFNYTIMRRIGHKIPPADTLYTIYGFTSQMCYYALPVASSNGVTHAPRGQESIALTMLQSSDYRTLSPTNGSVALADDAVTAGLKFGNNAGKPSTQGAVQAVFTLPFPINVNVPFIVDGASTAVFGTDYTITGVDPTTLIGSVQVPSGATSAAIAIVPLTATGAQTVPSSVQLRLLPSTNYLLAPAGTSPVNPTASITVAPVPLTTLNEQVFVSVKAVSGNVGPSPSNPSGPTNGSFTFTLTDLAGNPLGGTLTQALTITYTTGGTAVAGSDYVPLTGSAVIPIGAKSVTVPLVVQDDHAVTGNKGVTVTLSPNTGYQIGLQSSVTATINDYGPTLSVAVGAPATVNGVAGAFTITNSEPITGAVTLHYTATGSAVAGTDYVALSGAVSIPGGIYPNPVTVNIPVFANSGSLGKTISIVLSPDPLAPATYALVSPTTATMTVVNAVGIAATTQPTVLGAAGVFTVSLSAANSTATVVGYTATGSAVAGTDYTALSGTVTIPAGQTSATIQVGGAAVSALGKNITVTLSNDTASPATYGLATTSSATMTFQNAISIAATSRALGVGGTATFTVSDPVALGTSATVPITVGGTAVPGTDYTALPTTVVLPANATSAAITVTGIAASAAGKTLSVTLQASPLTPPAYNLGSAVTATTALFNVATIATSTSATGGGSIGVFTVTLSGTSAAATVIPFTATGSAAAGSDYTALSGSVTIPANATTATIPVTAAASGVGKTVVVTLQPDTNAPAAFAVGTSSAATMTIGSASGTTSGTTTATSTTAGGTTATSTTAGGTTGSVPIASGGGGGGHKCGLGGGLIGLVLGLVALRRRRAL